METVVKNLFEQKTFTDVCVSKDQMCSNKRLMEIYHSCDPRTLLGCVWVKGEKALVNIFRRLTWDPFYLPSRLRHRIKAVCLTYSCVCVDITSQSNTTYTGKHFPHANWEAENWSISFKLIIEMFTHHWARLTAGWDEIRGGFLAMFLQWKECFRQ